MESTRISSFFFFSGKHRVGTRRTMEWREMFPFRVTCVVRTQPMRHRVTSQRGEKGVSETNFSAETHPRGDRRKILLWKKNPVLTFRSASMMSRGGEKVSLLWIFLLPLLTFPLDSVIPPLIKRRFLYAGKERRRTINSSTPKVFLPCSKKEEEEEKLSEAQKAADKGLLYVWREEQKGISRLCLFRRRRHLRNGIFGKHISYRPPQQPFKDFFPWLGVCLMFLLSADYKWLITVVSSGQKKR